MSKEVSGLTHAASGVAGRRAFVTEDRPQPPGSAHESRVGRAVWRLLIAIPVLALIVLLLGVSVLAFLPNVLRAPIAEYMSDRLARPVTINGHLTVRPSLPLLVEVTEVVLGSSAGGSAPDLMRVERVIFRLELPPLLHGRVVVPEVHLFRPALTLQKDADGQANWRRGKPRTSAPHPAEIGSVQVSEGKLTYRDAILKAEADLEIESDTGSQTQFESGLRFTGAARVGQQPFRLEGHAANPLSLAQPGTPYRVEAQGTAQDASGSFSGTLVPLDWNTVDGTFQLRGSNLARLFPAAGTSLRRTPPYRLSGHVMRKDNVWVYDHLDLKVGRSDLRGTWSVTRSGERSRIVADIQSRRLHARDLGWFMGPTDAKSSQPGPLAHQPADSESASAARALPSKSFDPRRLRRIDADVRFRGERVFIRDLPLDHVAAHLVLESGELRLSPLAFDVAGGHVSSGIALDAREDKIRSAADVSLRDLEIGTLFPKLSANHGGAGKLSGHATLRATGNSVAQSLASSDGRVDLLVPEGRVSALALVLADLDLGKAAELVVFGDRAARVDCMVASASMRSGVLVADHLIVDSSEANITGEGSIDFRDEHYDLRVKAKSKHASIARLHAPILIAGTFKHPEVHAQTGPIAGRVAAAIALGALLTPFAALVPLIDLGSAKDSGCNALAAQIASRARTDNSSSISTGLIR
jgi:AsmA family protein